MKCLNCKFEFPADFFDHEKSFNRSTGYFRCSQCQAAHVRTVAYRSTDGTPVHDIRLWGHPATRRFTVPPQPSSGKPRNGVAV